MALHRLTHGARRISASYLSKAPVGIRLYQVFPIFPTDMYMIDDTKCMTHSLVHCLQMHPALPPPKHFKMQLRENVVVKPVTLKSL